MDSRRTASYFDGRSSEDSLVKSQPQEEDKEDHVNSEKLIVSSLVSSESQLPTVCCDNDTSIEADVTHSESPSPMLGGSPLHLSKLQGAWTKPLFIAEDTPQGPPMALEFSGKDNSEWPALSSHSNGKTRVEVAQSTRIKTHLQVSKRDEVAQTQRVKIPTDKTQFPWAAQMNPQSRNLHRVTVSEYMEDGTPKKGFEVSAVENTAAKLDATLPSDTHAHSSPQQKSTTANHTKSTTTQNTECDVNQQTSVPPVHTVTSLPPTVFESSSIEELNVSRVVESATPIFVEELLSLTTISVLENMYMSPTIVCINEETDSPPLDSAPSLQNMDSTPQETSSMALKDCSSSDPVHLVSNQFASLAYLEGEEDGQLDMDDCTDSIDLMTPTGKRMLRERPVKPTAKAKELQMQSTSRGRGNRGRGNRGTHLHYPSF
ncbi:hypothetical protein HID58_085764 [Brassica napus]|uniref:Uncharacterized protein n=1 Tax=Brassica napus TaxID=3708 RepID=A0ABQ7XR06_BRANA|nr:hypothetical protein HID58_085764 [Brassica napus]